MAEFDESKTICPHCGEHMQKWVSPAVDSWGGDCLYICFNDQCGYYQRGWDHTFKKIGIKASYRHRYDPNTGQTGPFPVNTPDAGRDCIVAE
ncbi:MAG: ogr/Delta-like zinc finger family protein [Desulfarculus sp.]|nr:ogr/Delta-like zinc finger family protein [Pseudomonadota bacterium]MBU4599330.1 ogr/Delta-like zinc finger family protein [Pseudomonadota bacterium]MBV1716324.1 ogr/Delta-like zinc finger family protein [Desulfarculus sp.]MBV1739353.1 ogr/Delta-like zinc finger family protein [Desulfarculus sp.]